MSASTEALPTPGAQPEPVVAEDATKEAEAEEEEEEDLVQTSMFVAEVASIINHEDINGILATQAEVQQRFKESNESLTHFNEFSATTYTNLSGEYERHTKALKEMKKDLDNVFKRIRQMQSMLRQRYPESFMNT
eukprot:Phypoly_transcript_17591.p1 GENE.Phypoly_transcript_17591~~Phypoly_transcript_17591.p1  ORF type:complete len:135 (+),score=26.11 Phypoly_transcript_17591:344-748(+)